MRKVAYLGGSMEYTLGSGAGELFAVSHAVETPLAPGACVAVTFAAHGVVAVPPDA